MNRTVCVYHGGCTDGVAAAWAFHRANPGAHFIPGVYQTDPDWSAFEDAEVWFLDFSYKRDVLLRIASQARSVSVIDHHKSAEADLINLPDNCRTFFDMNACGALLTWRHFHENDPPPLLEHIDNRDRWVQPRLLYNDEIIFALRSYAHEAEGADYDALFSEWTHLMERDINSIIHEGAGIARYVKQRVRDMKKLTRPALLGDYEMPLANCPWFLGSEVAGELAEESEYGVAAIWWYNSHGTVTFSLRSRNDGPDVSEIAAKFGGGGHRGAAGFAVAEDPWTFLLESF